LVKATEDKDEASNPCKKQKDALQPLEISLLEPVKESPGLIQSQQDKGCIAEDPLPRSEQLTDLRKNR
jgi:hypothetical protein